jgi:Fic family protein
VSPSYRRDEPYNDLPLLPPKAEVETVRTLKRTNTANKALAELKGLGDLLPNQSMLVRAIVLQEARLSSEIENIVTTDDEMYRALADDPERTDAATKEVLRYGHALWHGYSLIKQGRPLMASTFVEIVRQIKQIDLGIRTLPGTRIRNQRTGEVVYAPPEGEERLRRLLDNLSAYLYSEEDIDPLIKMAVAHYQFEAIHPFPDGNGRTGRVINILYLVDQGLLRLPVLYLSGHIIRNKAAYYEGLRAVTEEGAWEDWIGYMLDAVEATARETKDRIDSIREALDGAFVLARTAMGRSYKKEVVEIVFEQPYTKIQALANRIDVHRVTASDYLQSLERVGLLTSVKIGKETYYINTTLMRVLRG